eukprot:m51a1_g400 hypothetical protein (534) ;mRNA; r:719405-722338
MSLPPSTQPQPQPQQAQATAPAPEAPEAAAPPMEPLRILPPGADSDASAAPAPDLLSAAVSSVAAAYDVAASVATSVAQIGGELLSTAYQAAVASDVPKKALDAITSVPTATAQMVGAYAPGVIAGVQAATTSAMQGLGIASVPAASVVLMCGNNALGSLGVGPSKLLADRSSLVPIPAFPPRGLHVVQVSCGNKFTLAVLESGELYWWGDNQNGTLFPAVAVAPTLLQVPRKVSRVFAGLNRIAFTTDGGDLFAWGFNANGELGLGDTRARSVPTEVGFFKYQGAQLSDLCFGGYHSVALTTTGAVFTWGRNDYGQLGHGDKTARSTPAAVSAIAGVAHIAAGSSHTAVITEEGAVLTWGANGSGQLGIAGVASERSAPQPAFVEALASSRAISVSCGVGHTVVATSNGEVLSCGRNESGQLGVGDIAERKVPVRVAPFGSEGVNAIRVVCRGNTSLVVCGNGDVYSWGDNEHGQLAVGNKRPGLLPSKLVVPCADWTLASVQCGYDHLAVLGDVLTPDVAATAAAAAPAQQ